MPDETKEWTPQMVERVGTLVPRRNCVDLYTPAEGAILDAIGAVEEAGASTHLTDAVDLLIAARAKVADHVEGKPQR